MLVEEIEGAWAPLNRVMIVDKPARQFFFGKKQVITTVKPSKVKMGNGFEDPVTESRYRHGPLHSLDFVPHPRFE